MEKLIKNRFLVEQKLGEGPYRLTYKAKDTVTGNPLVVKVFRRSPSAERKLDGILGKMRTLQGMHHPVLPRYEEGDFGWQGFYTIREYVVGESLKEKMARGERLAETQILHWTAQLSEVLELVHERGILHGAIHLSNVFVRKDGSPKLVDFVVDPMLCEGTGHRVKMIERDPHFLSPEEILGEPPSPVSDIYRMGVLLYRLWTGRYPFENGSAYHVALSVLRRTPLPPSEVNAQVPATASQAILRALSQHPEDRFIRVADFAAALQTGVSSRTRVALDLPPETEGLLQQLAKTEVRDRKNLPTMKKVPSHVSHAGNFRIQKVIWVVFSAAVALGAAYFFYRFILV